MEMALKHNAHTNDLFHLIHPLHLQQTFYFSFNRTRFYFVSTLQITNQHVMMNRFEFIPNLMNLNWDARWIGCTRWHRHTQREWMWTEFGRWRLRELAPCHLNLFRIQMDSPPLTWHFIHSRALDLDDDGDDDDGDEIFSLSSRSNTKYNLFQKQNIVKDVRLFWKWVHSWNK